MDGAQIIIKKNAHGRDWVWHPSLNTVALADHLDAAGRERALDELQAEWRRTLEWDEPLSA